MRASPPPPEGKPVAEGLRFVCGVCATHLILPHGESAVSGPCPRCGTWIDATKFRVLEPSREAHGAKPRSQGTVRRRNTENVIAGRGNVRADGYLDHGFTERREMFGTLRVFAVSLAVMALIVLIALYLRHWMAS